MKEIKNIKQMLGKIRKHGKLLESFIAPCKVPLTHWDRVYKMGKHKYLLRYIQVGPNEFKISQIWKLEKNENER